MAEETAKTPKRRKYPPSRRARNQRRSEERRAIFEEGRTPTAPPSTQREENKPPEQRNTKAASRWIKWVTKSLRRLRMEPQTVATISRKEGPHLDPAGGEDSTSAGPAQLYSSLEETYRLSRLEEPRITEMALRHLIRHLHPNGKSITFRETEAADRLHLKCVNLPKNPTELKAQVFKVFERRGEPLDLDEVYGDLARNCGRTTTDFTQPWPRCYAHVRHP